MSLGPATGLTSTVRAISPAPRPRPSDCSVAVGATRACGSASCSCSSRCSSGATLFSRADDTVAVWAADSDLHAGRPLTSDDVHSTRVHFADSSDAARYLRASEPIPPGAVAARDVAAGELVAAPPSARRGSERRTGCRWLWARRVCRQDSRVGDTVDVWAVPAADAAGTGATSSSAGPRRRHGDVSRG